jgi:hypothetical protein
VVRRAIDRARNHRRDRVAIDRDTRSNRGIVIALTEIDARARVVSVRGAG